jgi:hypothetical protein
MYQTIDTPRHQLKESSQKRSGDFALSETKVIPWPLPQSLKVADTINGVQIAIEDQA